MKTRTNQPVTTFDVEDLEVTHELKGFENIVDKDGHKRFIEGDITTPTTEGVEIVYAKWSLSGTHLMFVLAGNIANGTAISYNNLGSVKLPQWLSDKIIPVVQKLVIRQTILVWDSAYGTQNQIVNLLKDTGDIMQIQFSPLTYSADRTFRVQFDLLIDND